VQQTAIEALGKLGSSNVVEALVKKIRSGNPYIRLAVIKALNKIANRGSREELCSEKVSSQKRQNTNMERVGRDIFLNVIENLIDIMKRDLPEFQIAAIDALGKIGLSLAIDPLLTMLSSENDDIKKSVIIAIGKIGEARIDERYFEAIENTEKPIEEAFLEAYKEIDIKLLVKTLTPFVGHVDSGIQLATSTTLNATGYPILR
jgi:HEAT repeat protein